jgi:phosphomannomutase
MGAKVHFLSGPTPTPVAAYAVEALGAAAGIVVTASHNPPDYNGYKVYWENGAQIIPPIDQRIAAEIARAPDAKEIERAAGPFADADFIKERYVEETASLVFDPDVRPHELSIAYSAMHGVGERTVRQVLARRGFDRFYSVPEQAEPDAAFPTVKFPNPEEPGALDLVLAHAEEHECDLVLVNDPDADRLGVAVRDGLGDYVVLNGNQIGALLAHHLITHTEGERLVITTYVSSQLLKKMAAAFGVRYAETATGFKWIANEAIRRQKEARFLFGYEEALGYTIGTSVRDKDGISAALVMAEMAASLKRRGLTLLDQLDALRADYGLFASRQKSFTLSGPEGAAKIALAMERLRAARFDQLGGSSVVSRQDLVEHGLVMWDLADGGRVCARPSGTEPKLKLYLEVVEPISDDADVRALKRLELAQRELVSTAGL